MVGATCALAILAGASLVGALLLPDAHWRGGAMAFIACPVVMIGARAVLALHRQAGLRVGEETQ